MTQQKIRALVVEDEIVSRTLLTAILQGVADWDVAEDGKEALVLFELGLTDGRPYDVVFLDIMMPGINGQQVLQEIRSKEERRNILGLDGTKVIMVSALEDKRNVLEAFRFGSEAYLTKPISRESVLRELDKFQLVPRMSK